MSISRSRIVASVAVIYTLSAVAGLQPCIHAVLGTLLFLVIKRHRLTRNRHEVVGTAVKVGSKVERGIK